MSNTIKINHHTTTLEPIINPQLQELQQKSIETILNGWIKTMLGWHYNSSCKLVALELPNYYSCTITTELHKLHTYTIPHIMSCIHYNTINSFNNTRAIKNMLNCNEITNGHYNSKPSCKASYKSSYFP